MTKRHVGKVALGLMVVVVLFHTMGYFTQPESSNMNVESADAGVEVKNFEVMFADNDDGIVQDDSNSAASSDNWNNHSSEPKEEWWKGYVEQTSIVFQASNNTDWCQGTPTQNRQSVRRMKKQKKKRKQNVLSKTGMYLVKTAKAGSSTVAAVSLQIAKAIAARKGLAQSCPSHVHHGIDYLSRKEPYFLWTIVREPAKRSISSYFFADVSRRGIPYNSKNLIAEMKKERNFQLKYIGLQPGTASTLYFPRNATNPQVMEMVHNILKTYHFIAITERMDESLVVMKLLFNIPDEAMVVLSSKRAGGFDDGNFKNRCYKIQPSYTTPDVDEYIATKFRRKNWDYYLYEAANRSLDRTIDMLGRDRVEREVTRHKELEKLAIEKCYNTAVFPCTKEGARPRERAKESCFFGDVGCGHECVQTVIRDHVSATRQ